MKSKATNEQLAKVLEYTLSEHQKSIEKSEKERNAFLTEFKNEVQSLKSINLEPNLTKFETLNRQLEQGAIEGGKTIKRALKSAYLSPVILGIVFTVFVSGVGMLVYSFKKLQTANEVADAKELALKNYFLKFLKENPKADASFNDWKEKQ